MRGMWIEKQRKGVYSCVGLHACQCASAFKLSVSILKPVCYGKCLSERVCVLRHRIPIASDTARAFRLPHCVLHSKSPITSKSSLLSIKTIKTTLRACRIITEGGCHILHSRSSTDEHVHCIMAGVNGAQQGQIEML